jgi:hypothetical protein
LNATPSSSATSTRRRGSQPPGSRSHRKYPPDGSTKSASLPRPARSAQQRAWQRRA